MLKNKTIAVVIPCYNEELLLSRVIETMPDFVDKIYIVDDLSTDNTLNIAQQLSQSDSRIRIIRHSSNQGVGGAIASGYIESLKDNNDVTVVMAGDAQMDPDDLPAIVQPIIEDGYDYSKGNRLFSGEAWDMIPKIRYLGNSMLSLLTKISSGYWNIADSQSGYTAISKKALATIDWSKMYKRYGQPNDLLVRLNIENFRVKDVHIKPVYNIGERSGIKPIRLIPKLSWLLFKLFWMRMFHKYIIRDFHPLVFFYSMAQILLPIGIFFGFYLIIQRIFLGPIAETSALFSAFLTIMGFQFLFFGMFFDMEANRHLK